MYKKSITSTQVLEVNHHYEGTFYLKNNTTKFFVLWLQIRKLSNLLKLPSHSKNTWPSDIIKGIKVIQLDV